jgi:hypothetical protein
MAETGNAWQVAGSRASAFGFPWEKWHAGHRRGNTVLLRRAATNVFARSETCHCASGKKHVRPPSSSSSSAADRTVARCLLSTSTDNRKNSVPPWTRLAVSHMHRHGQTSTSLALRHAACMHAITSSFGPHFEHGVCWQVIIPSMQQVWRGMRSQYQQNHV